MTNEITEHNENAPVFIQPQPKTLKFHGLETSLETHELQDALAKFQLEVMQPKKDADNPFFGSKYVPFGNIVTAIMSVAPKYGISYVQWAVQNEKNQIGICTRINHKSGQFMSFDPVYQSPAKPTVQDNGSVQSYLRRYSLQAAFGLGAEEDDDGNSASGIQQGETPAQKAYRENQEKKNQSSYQKGSYKNQKQNNNNAPKSSQNGTNSAPNGSGNTKAATAPEKATEGQITKIKAICESIANTQNIHPDDVYLKFQTIYKEQANSNIPDMDKLSKGWAGGVISGLTKHNEAGQLTKIIPKDAPKKEESKPTKEQQEQIDQANYDAEAHGDR